MNTPWYGFNFQWIFRRDHATPVPVPADEKALDAIAGWGFNFVRIPADYRFWASPEDYQTVDESPLELIDSYIQQCRARQLHASLNLHRVPGYCINGANLEKRNLWTDEVAQDAVVGMWRSLAERYSHVPAEALSFDLINELPSVGQRGFTREINEVITRRISSAIRSVTPDRMIVVDGIDGGHTSVPELADVSDVQSGRGYAPTGLSHFGSDWWDIASGLEPNDEVRARLGRAREDWWLQGAAGRELPEYPGQVRDEWWDREALNDHFSHWDEVEAGGSRVHIGEMGCYYRVPNDVALRWMSDMLRVFAQRQWGWALWNFDGPFGIVNTRRVGARQDRRNGYTLDGDMLDLLQENRLREKP
jgi:endoglucanase